MYNWWYVFFQNTLLTHFLDSFLPTVSLGKGFGFKGKQHYKHAASEPQQVIQPNAKKNHGLFLKQLSPALPQLTFVHLALDGNTSLSVSTESVNLDLAMRQNILCYLFASACLCGSVSKWALKHGAGEAAGDRSQGSHSVPFETRFRFSNPTQPPLQCDALNCM